MDPFNPVNTVCEWIFHCYDYLTVYIPMWKRDIAPKDGDSWQSCRWRLCLCVSLVSLHPRDLDLKTAAICPLSKEERSSRPRSMTSTRRSKKRWTKGIASGRCLLLSDRGQVHHLKIINALSSLRLKMWLFLVFLGMLLLKWKTST